MEIVESLSCVAENTWITPGFLWKDGGEPVEKKKLWETGDILYFEGLYLLGTIYCASRENVKEKIYLRKKYKKAGETVAVRQNSTF